MPTYEDKRDALANQLRAKGHAPIALEKTTSNLFRERVSEPRVTIDARNFNQVLRVDPDGEFADVEGMARYLDVLDATLAHGLMPAVVPELKSITVGGAIAGVGIESTSFKYGLVHETVAEMEILLADGTIVYCSADNEHKDLFFGFPNSFGTLGYLLKARIKTVPVKRYVHLEHIAFGEPTAFFARLEELCHSDIDFLDGTVFSPQELYLTVGTFADDASQTSDYTYMDVYYRSIRTKQRDALTVKDYLWRWDTDWFWCSKNVFAHYPFIRRLLGRERLNSMTYTKVMRWNNRWGLTRRLNRLRGLHSESVIQDVDVPIGQATEFLRFFHREIGISPVWVCPIRRFDPHAHFELYPLEPHTTYVNFGFWDVISGRSQHPAGYYNRQIEDKVHQLGGMKSLYSDAFYTREEFWSTYNKPAYDRLKARYDAEGRLLDLYQKCVLRQ